MHHKSITAFLGNDPQREQGKIKITGRMKIADLPISKRVIANLKKMGYEHLLDHQIEGCGLFLDMVVPKDVVNEKLIATRAGAGVNLKKARNLLVTYPTSAGKTLVAFIYASHLLQKVDDGIVIYTCSLHAPAIQKRDEFAMALDGVANVGIAIGDLQSSASWDLGRFDVIVTTYEKLDSLLRKMHDYKWTRRIAGVVIDELHNVEDPSRGPILEDVVSKLKQRDIPILGLSATIANKDDMMAWLGSKSSSLISESTFRPVPLERGLFYKDGNGNLFVKYEDRNETVRRHVSDDAFNLIIKLLKKGVQFLYFRQSVNGTVSLAYKIATWISKHEPSMKTALTIPNAKSPTEQRLDFCVRHGVAFHNAKMKYEHKQFVERHFVNGKIRVIVSTPTLTESVNLPARYVITEVLRFEKGRGMALIPRNEYIQASGRAGRWGYDDKGTVIVVNNNVKDVNAFMRDYVLADPSPISSHYNNPMILHSSILGIVAGKYATTIDGVLEFLQGTLAYQQFGRTFLRDARYSIGVLMSRPHPLIKETNGNLVPTKIGDITNKLYLHPFTTRALIETITMADDHPSKLGLLHALARTVNFGQLYAIPSEWDHWRDFYVVNNNLFIWDDVDLDDDFEINAIKTATILMGDPYVDVSWTDDDYTYADIEEYWHVLAGDLERLVGSRGNADWVLTGFQELAILFKRLDIREKLDEMKWQLKYGVSERLIPLVKIPYIGKERAKLLYQNGCKHPSSMKTMTPETLAKLIRVGASNAKKILDHVVVTY